MRCPHCGAVLKDEKILQLHLKVCPKREKVESPRDESPKMEIPVESPKDGGKYEVFYPKPDPYFLVPEDVKIELEIAEKLSQKHHINLLVTGQPGGGKTTLALQFAARYNRPCVVVDFGILQEPQELFHTTYLVSEGGSSRTDIRESGFVRGLETERCVVVLDELNRPENERVLNVLLPFLDGRGGAYIDYLRRKVTVAPQVVFIATLNEGAMFCGVTTVDTALRDRFREIYMPYLPPDYEVKVLMDRTGIDEKIAVCLATFAYKVRTSISERKVSTRQLITAAENYVAGDSLWRAVSTAIGHHNNPAWRQQVMEILSFQLPEKELVEWRKSLSQRGNYVRL